MTEQYPPIGTESAKQMFPIDFVGAAFNQMSYISAVVSLAFHDERFHPNDLFGSAEFHFLAQQLAIACSIKPGLIYATQTVSGSENQIDHVVAAFRLGQPMWERLFAFITARLKYRERPIQIARLKKQIEIFGVARNAGVHTESVGTAHK